MKKRNFLLPLASLASVFTSEQALANVNQDVHVTPQTNDAAVQKFSFVLKRVDGGALMAWHESHASHASHASHSSHRSHYSGY
jgi:hypothetical protein